MDLKTLLKRFVSLSLTAAFLFSLAACGGSDGVGRSFAYPIPSEPSTLDPQVCSGTAALTAVTNLYEGLVRIGDDGAVLPGAAGQMQVSDDGLSYAFRLRDGLKWHLIDNFSGILGDGFRDTFDASLTAKDFVFGLRRALSPSTASPDAASLYVIKNAEAVHGGQLPASSLGVTATDDRTLVITLSSACADFLSLLAQPCCMPCNEAFFDACKGRYGIGLGYTLCNGPFYLSKWTAGASLLMKQNGDYTGDAAALPYAVTLYFNPDENGYAKKVADGVYDAAFCRTGAALPSDASKCTVTDYQNTVWGLCVNCGDEALASVYLRLALCGAFDRSRLGFSDSLTPADGLLASGCRVGGENYREKAGRADFVAFNVEKASDYWETGRDALGLSAVSLTVLCTADFEKPVRRLIQYWQQAFGISVNATASVVEADALKKAVAGGDYQLALAPVTAPSPVAAVCLTDYFPGSGRNLFGFASDAYVKTVGQIFKAGSSSSAAEGCRTSESYLMQNGAFYPFFETAEHLVLAENVSGIRADPAGQAVCFASAVKI